MFLVADPSDFLLADPVADSQVATVTLKTDEILRFEELRILKLRMWRGQPEDLFARRSR